MAVLTPLLVLSMGLAACSASSGVSSVEANQTESTGTDPAGTDPTGTDPAGTDPTDPGDTGTVDWGACDEETPDLGVGLECATLEMPRDYDEPDGDTIDIALARVPATDPGERIGSLVFNPGGPGGSGIEFLQSAALVVPEDIAAKFDLVAFDPRGVGASTAVDCDIQIDDNIALLAEGDDEGWAALVDEAKSVPDKCPAAALDLAPLVGTNNAARDLDQIREALGDDQLTYVGFSYGTRLGATYAELFPDRVRALVLDGGVKPTDDLAELDRETGTGFDKAFENFAAACAADEDCVLNELGPVIDTYEALVADIATAGSYATDDADRVLTPGELQLGVREALYSKDAWPILAEALHAASTDQDGTGLQRLADEYMQRQPDGSYANLMEANLFIDCADDPHRPDEATVREQADESAAGSTYFADSLRADTGCIGTPDPVDPLIIGPAEGSAPILVIGNSGDPATPYDWSVALADSLSSAVLYTVEAEGHTAFLTIDCVEPVVTKYLIDLEMPDADASCSDNATADFFPPAGQSDAEVIVELFDCLRENGADVPELSAADVLADPTGETILGELDVTDPAFAAAAAQCQDIIGQL